MSAAVMNDEATPTRVPPASPMNKSGGGSKRSESPRSTMSGGKVIPHYLRASTGSCHEFCKHGKPEERVNGVRDSRPWRKSVTGNGREDVGAVTASIKKSVIVKSKRTVGAEMLMTTESIDLATDQASSGCTTAVTCEPYTSDGPETTVRSPERAKQESMMLSEHVILANEGDPLDAEDVKVSEKSSASPPPPPPPKPSPRSPLSISAGSRAARNMEGRKSMSGDKMNSIGGQSLPEKSELSKKQVAVPKPVILKMKASPSLTSVPAKQPSPLHPSSSRSRNNIAAKSPTPLHPTSAPNHNHIAAKPPSPLHRSNAPSCVHISAKSPSPLHPSSGTNSKTISDNKVTTKLSTSKLDMKKVDASVVVSQSSGSSVNEEEITNMKKVRVIRVVSTIRRQRKVTKVAANNPDEQGLRDETVEANNIKPAKISTVNSNEETTSDSLLPSVSKSTVRSRISYASPKKLSAEPGQKAATKEASTSGLRKGKAVDSQTNSHRPNSLKAGRVPLIGETTHKSRRSLKKRISSGGITIEKSSSGRFLTRRPSARQKKNAQVLFNKVIEETASRLVRTSKSKVLALVGAFETVISIQRKSSAETTPKSKKRSSSKTSE